jgi:hypothetical protein
MVFDEKVMKVLSLASHGYELARTMQKETSKKLLKNMKNLNFNNYSSHESRMWWKSIFFGIFAALVSVTLLGIINIQ